MQTESVRFRRHYWNARDLVVIGVFSASIKLSSVLIALAGGGINPVTSLLRNIVFAALVVVMLFKIRKPGTLLLFVGVNSLVSTLLWGGSVTVFPAAMTAAAAGELAMWASGGIRSRWGIFAGVAIYSCLSKILGVAVSLLYLRESPAVVWLSLPFVALGFAGAMAGLVAGARIVKELRHAGIIHQ